MRKQLLSICFILSGLFSFAQDNPMPALYYLKDNLLNPGFTGLAGGINLKAGYKQQLLGFEEAPNIKFAGLEAFSPKNKIGYGFNVAQDENGPLKRSFVQGIFAYRVNYDTEESEQNSTHYLSVGITAGVHQHILEYSEFTPLETDPILQALLESTLSFNSDFGLLYFNKGFRAGIAFHDIVPNKIEPLSGKRDKLVYPSGYVNLGYEFNPAEGNLVVYPHVVFGAQLNDFLLADLNIASRFFLGESKFLGLRAGYRTMSNYNNISSNSLMFQAELGFSPLALGYQYTLPLGGNQMYSMGEQALYLSLQFNSNSSTKNPAKEKTIKKPKNWFN
jgi:type IX secretion system PorP/SprF family membrane protein